MLYLHCSTQLDTPTDKSVGFLVMKRQFISDRRVWPKLRVCHYPS